jgi:diaminopimelate epimerase
MADVQISETLDNDYIVNTGSPHLVRFMQGVENFDVFNAGRHIRYSERFRAEGTNVDFAEWMDGELFVRSYERGVENETLSCGTGVTASALVFAARNNMDSGTIGIRTLGGKLSISFVRNENGFSEVWLEGPAKMVFQGTYFTK